MANIERTRARIPRPLAKNTANVPAIQKAADLAAKVIARMENEMKAVHAAESAKRLQLISAGKDFHALIGHGNVKIQIEGSDFVVTTSE